MFFTSAINAMRESMFDEAVWDAEAREGARHMPIIGGLWSRAGQFFNNVYRPFKMAGAFILGCEKKEPPAMPGVPESFKGKQLGKAFEEAWALKVEAIEARAESYQRLLSFDFTGYQEQASIANYARTKETNVTFAEERTVRTGGSSFFSSGTAGNLGELVSNIPASSSELVTRITKL